jgi:succinyl-diaminopimelate desuccinylase
VTEPATSAAHSTSVPVDSIVELTRDLIRIPSRGGEDPPEPIIEAVTRWLTGSGVPTTVLQSDAGERVAVVAEITGARPGPTYCIDACLDTAPFGDLDAWKSPPTEPRIADGWLYGRGAADSKVAVAIFSHLAAELEQRRDQLAGRLLVLFDADEHTGQFAGVKTFLRHYPDLDGVMIGYPGNHGVIVGARGFYRATVTLHGIGGHSGGRRTTIQNAVEKAAELVRKLSDANLPDEADAAFPLPPSVTVTAINGGSGYSMVPDRCEVDVDVRLTPRFEADDARRLIREAVAEVDRTRPGREPGSVNDSDTWPPYRLPDTAPLVQALVAAAQAHHDAATQPVVCGPSNIGNYFAAHGIDATCGFGVSYEAVHGANERARVDTVAMVYRVYAAAIESLLRSGDSR